MMIRFTFSLVMLSTCYASSLITPKDIDGFAQNPMVGIKALLDVKTIDTEGISMEEASQYFRSFEKFCAAAINNGQKDYLSYLAAYPLRDTAFETIIKVQLNNLYFDEIIKSEDFKNKLKENKIRAQLLQGIGKDIKAKEKKIKELTSQIEKLNEQDKLNTEKTNPVPTEIVSEINEKTTKKPAKKAGKKSVRFSEEVDNFPLVGDEKLEKSKTEWNEPDHKGNYKLNRDKTASTYTEKQINQKKQSNSNDLENEIKKNPLDQMLDEALSLHIERKKETEINKAVVKFCEKENLSDSILSLTNLVTGYEGDYVYLKKHQLSVIKKIVENYLHKKTNISFEDLKKLISLKVGGDGIYDKFWVLIRTLYEIQLKTKFNNLSETEKSDFLSLLKSNLDKFETRVKGTVAGLMYKVLKLRLQPETSPSIKSSEGPVTKEVQDAVQYDPEFDKILSILDPDISLDEQLSEFSYSRNSAEADAIMKYLFEDKDSNYRINATIAFVLNSMDIETFNEYLKSLRDFVKCKKKFRGSKLDDICSLYEKELKKCLDDKSKEECKIKYKKMYDDVKNQLDGVFNTFITKYIETFVNRFVPASNLSAQFHAENGSAWLIDTFALFKGKLEKMGKTEQVKKAIIELEKWEENLPKHNREKYLETTREESKERKDFFDKLNKEYTESLEKNGGRKDSKKQVKF